MSRLNATFPVVRENRTMADAFRDFLSFLDRRADVYALPASDQSGASYTLTANDANTVRRFTTANPAVTIPTNAAVPYVIGTYIGIRQAGTGTLVLTTTGLTINGTVAAWAQHRETWFRKVDTNTWDVV